MFTMDEQETVISYGPTENYVTVYTNMPHMVKKYRKLSALDGVTVVRDEDDAIEVRVDKKYMYVTVKKPRVLDPEELELRRERMRHLTAMRKQQKGETE